MFAKDDEGAQAEDPQQPQEVLSDSEATLNATFYHVLLLCLKGPAHDTILHASSKTWADAMALLPEAEVEVEFYPDVSEMLVGGDVAVLQTHKQLTRD